MLSRGYPDEFADWLYDRVVKSDISEPIITRKTFIDIEENEKA
jgi:hypothetical protein